MRLRSRGQHRAQPMDQRWQIDRLAAENERLRNAIRRLQAGRNELESHLDEAAIDYSSALDDLRAARDENNRLRTECAQTVRVVPLHQSPLAEKEAP